MYESGWSNDRWIRRSRFHGRSQTFDESGTVRSTRSLPGGPKTPKKPTAAASTGSPGRSRAGATQGTAAARDARSGSHDSRRRAEPGTLAGAPLVRSRCYPTASMCSFPRLGFPRPMSQLETHESTRKLARRLEQGSARIVAATISRQADRWFVSFTVEVERYVPASSRLNRQLARCTLDSKRGSGLGGNWPEFMQEQPTSGRTPFTSSPPRSQQSMKS